MSQNNQHAARLRAIAADLIGMDSDTPDAAALLAGAEALEKCDHMRRFAEALSADGNPVLMGFAYQIDRILDAEDTAALARLEGR